MTVKRTRDPASICAGLVLVMGALAGCASGGSPSAPASNYFSPTATSASAHAPSTTAPAPAHSSTSVAPPAEKISLPDPDLTPGAVADTNAVSVCASPLRQRQHISKPTASEVYAKYGLYPPPYGDATSHYGLDYLVPLTLGGSTKASNVWPASLTGIGFAQKQQLTAKLRTLVCENKVSLTSVQHQLEVNWYQLWVTYVSDGTN